MKLMMIGGGGREHALIKKLKENPTITEFYALPGNGGIAKEGVTCLPIKATDIAAQVEFATKTGIDFAVVAPDDPLALGAVDALEAAGIPCFGPRQCAAVIESSKIFSKQLMEKYNIPTAACRIFTEIEPALEYVAACPLPTVVKADGLALGKGVSICLTREEAEAAVRAMMEDRTFGDSGSRIVVEEFLTGPEVSVLAFTDGTTLVPMASSMDHKRALDGDQGLNTGGMGTIAPNPYYTEAVAAECMETIFLPTIKAMKEEGREFRGCLYFGLMLTPNGPKVIEYNCRFGDPETQVVLPLLKGDLLTIMQAVRDGRLAEVEVGTKEGAAACVIMASGGYPGAYEKGKAISLPTDIPEYAHVIIAGAKLEDDTLLTSGGRVLGAVAQGQDLPQALQRAYALADAIDFEKAHYRRDIGKRALEVCK